MKTNAHLPFETEPVAAKLAALAAHQQAVRQWLDAHPADRPPIARQIDAAWRTCAHLGIRFETAQCARDMARSYGAIA